MKYVEKERNKKNRRSHHDFPHTRPRIYSIQNSRYADEHKEQAPHKKDKQDDAFGKRTSEHFRPMLKIFQCIRNQCLNTSKNTLQEYGAPTPSFITCIVCLLFGHDISIPQEMRSVKIAMNFWLWYERNNSFSTVKYED